MPPNTIIINFFHLWKKPLNFVNIVLVYESLTLFNGLFAKYVTSDENWYTDKYREGI